MDKTDSRGRPWYSIRRARVVLPHDYQPVTVAVFFLPFDMSEKEIQEHFEKKYGAIDHVRLGWSLEEVEYRRTSTQIVFRDRTSAEDCLRDKVQVVPFWKYNYKVKVRMSNNQNYKKEMQAAMDERLKRMIERWDETPEERRMRRHTDRFLQELIPYYNPDEFDY